MNGTALELSDEVCKLDLLKAIEPGCFRRPVATDVDLQLIHQLYDQLRWSLQVSSHQIDH